MQEQRRERIAIIGSGISGLATAHALDPQHDITVLEADSRVGGHSNTVVVEEGGRSLGIDTGFIVYNQRNYPLFSRLLESLGVKTQASEMSFSYSSDITGLEYSGTSLNTLLARRSNILRPSFVRMLADVPRFGRDASRLLASGDISTSLADFLADGGYSRPFIDDYLVPLGASIWSADPVRFAEFPAAPLARFLERHGLLSLQDRPEWRTVSGGSREYVKALVAPFADRVRTSHPVRKVWRDRDSVLVFSPASPEPERFDRVVFATHADTTLAILADPSPAETSVLGAFHFQRNRATLHTDSSLLPARRRAWASWNYRQVGAGQRLPVISYYANRLQRLESKAAYITTLNADTDIDSSKMLASFDYTHPVFDSNAMKAQLRHGEIDGVRNTHFCGAYWGYGFHEDGVQSAVTVCRRIELAGRRAPRAGLVTV
ncbi:MAG TPA: FAD-dependent oxidoreductase [Candidatus Dormibacteraeota bacterium]|nr:FAD-dependent oxidoreductase [Candidatus Dormibacteraeota bacterium]